MMMPSNENTYEGRAICNPFHSYHRYLFIFFICFLSFGFYFCMDNPAALTDDIVNDMDVSMEQYMKLYSYYSVPNTVLSLVGGILIDRVLGARVGAIIFSSFCLLGQVVFASGGFFPAPYGFNVMQIGRFIFEIGGGTLTVCQNVLSVQWLKGKELHLAFGARLVVSKFSSLININIMNPIYGTMCEIFPNNLPRTNLSITLYFGALMCIFSLIVAFIMFAMDYRASKIRRQYQVLVQDDEIPVEFKWLYLYKFPLQFWLIVVICVAYYCPVFPFTASAKLYIMNKFAFTEADAAGIISTIYIVPMMSSPFLGMMVDSTGMNITWWLVANLATIGGHLLLGYTFCNPTFAMFLLGNGYSLCACTLWPMVGLVVPERQLGISYGIMQAFQNVGLGGGSIIAGYIIDKYGYMMEELFFFFCLMLALTSTFLLLLVNRLQGSDLNVARWGKPRILRDTRRNPSPDEVQSVDLMSSTSSN